MKRYRPVVTDATEKAEFEAQLAAVDYYIETLRVEDWPVPSTTALDIVRRALAQTPAAVAEAAPAA